MNGKDRYLVDTNILIYFLQGDKPAVSFLTKIVDDELYISLVNKIEVLSFPELSEDDEGAINQFLVNFKTFDIDNAIAEETIRVRKKYRLKLGDALVCATSLVHDTVLVSRNEKDFSRVGELKFLNPYEKG